MKALRYLPTAALLAGPLASQAQLMPDARTRCDQMKYDVQYLASDLLEGRETGTKGERLAADLHRPENVRKHRPDALWR
jgi:hypothetical protein